MATQKPLTRDQLAKFLPDHEAIKAFERLFQIVENLSPSDIAILTRMIEETGIEAGVADNKGDRAISNLAQVDAVEFNLNQNVAARIGQAKWNKADQTLDLRMEYGVTQQIGQEYYARVGNTTGVTIPNGTVVGFVGATSEALLVAPYLADGSSPSLYILGVMTHDLPDSGEKGYCTTWGFVRDLDTSAFSVGDLLYASPTVAGALTNVKPTAPDNVIPLAACITSNATTGMIFVRRSFQDQPVYKLVLRHYIAWLLAKRFPLSWAFEGTRSRLGKLMPPKYGLMKYVLDAAHATGTRDVHFVPFVTSFDLILDVARVAAHNVARPAAPVTA